MRVYKSLRRRRKLRRLLLLGMLFVVAPFAALITVIITRDAWHTLDLSRITDTHQTLVVKDSSGDVASYLYRTENRIDINIEDLPKHVTNAFVAAEDARFYSHSGFDIIRIFGAAWSDIKAMSYVEGASTITQQLIKLTHLSNEKVMSRKLDEAILAWQLELLCSKEEILELYLNYVYFGKGCYGIEAAALGYFGVHARDLSLSQSALLAGVLKSPSRFAPHLRPEASVGRRGVILDLMVEYGLADPVKATAAKSEPLLLSPDPRIGRRGDFVDLVLTESCEKLNVSMDELLEGGYVISSTMDSELQSLCSDIFAHDEFFPFYNGESAQAALVLIDSKSGGVAALMGGRNSKVALGFNRATGIRRQPGSAIKPILVYAPALESGYTAVSMLLDEQTSFDDYTPRNANGRYSGWVTMREAVKRSLNIPAVSLINELGVEKCKRFAEQLGIEFDRLDTRPALALGGFTYGVSPYSLAGAYAALSNKGVYNEPFVIESITSNENEILYEHRPESRRVMSVGNAFILTSMLQSVVSGGTASRLNELGIDIAAKTGTVGDSESNRDIWLSAYNSEYSAVVWMGFDDSGDGRALPASVGGGTYPAELLYTLFSQIYKERSAPKFVQPSSVVKLRLDSYTLQSGHVAVLASGLTPSDYVSTEYFVRGTEPTGLSVFWSAPAPPTDLSCTVEDGIAMLEFTPPQAYVSYRVYRCDDKGYTVLVDTVSNASVKQCVYDSVAGLKGTYEYFVVPVHPILTIDGDRLTGAASDRLSVWLYSN